jgi:hypothetical protein
MQTKTQTGGQSTAHDKPQDQKITCIPCEIPAFCRSSYYTGKLLTARELTLEQRYAADKLRLHHLALHGWGVVCGLTVHPHHICPALRIVIRPGEAIDDCGREIRLLNEVEIELPKPDKHKRMVDPCPDYRAGEERPQQEQEHAYEHGQEQEHEQEYGRQHEHGQEHEHGHEHGHEHEHEHEPHEQPRTLYVCLQYAECGAEFAPAPFDECGCNGSPKKPNRICESYEICLLDHEPEFLHHAHQHENCGEGDCWDIYREILEDCPQPGRVPCVLLAVIRDFVPGRPVTRHMVDNWTYRPKLLSTRVIDRLIRCILHKIPGRKKLTRIIDFNWTHGQEYRCEDFHEFFVGSHHSPKGFEITFEDEVVDEGINARSFQATVVRYSPDASEPRRVEVAPSRVRRISERTYALQIEEPYAQRHLNASNFDVYVTLQCDKIVNRNGDAVDGNLLARLQEGKTYVVDSPTGDGVPGGLFESWIRVRHQHGGERRQAE